MFTLFIRLKRDLETKSFWTSIKYLQEIGVRDRCFKSKYMLFSVQENFESNLEFEFLAVVYS